MTIDHKNSVVLIGLVDKDPIVRPAGKGTVANFSIAVEIRGKKSWHKVAAWNALADEAKSIRAGELVEVHGRLENSSWTDKKTGNKAYKTEVVAERLHMLARIGAGTYPAGERVPAQTAIPEDDIPF